jgi:hypothetical protein
MTLFIWNLASARLRYRSMDSSSVMSDSESESLQAVGTGRLGRKRGKEDINIHFLKPAHFAVDPIYAIPPSISSSVVQNESLHLGEEYLTYAYRTKHPVLRWLPAKLAEWISSNLCDKLNIPPKQNVLWAAAELNTIITGNLVGGPHGHLHTFGCIQWECYLFNGRPTARCYPFDIQGHSFQNKNPKVHPFDLIDHNIYSNLYRTLYRSLYRMVYHTQCF